MSDKVAPIRNIAVSGKERGLLTRVANETGLPVVFETGKGDTHTATVLEKDLPETLKVLDAKELEFPV